MFEHVLEFVPQPMLSLAEAYLGLKFLKIASLEVHLHILEHMNIFRLL